MDQKEIDTIIESHLNRAINDAVKEIAEKSKLTSTRVLEEYHIHLKKSLFKVRKEL